MSLSWSKPETWATEKTILVTQTSHYCTYWFWLHSSEPVYTVHKAPSFDKRQLKTTNTNPIAQNPAWATKDKDKVKNAQRGEPYSNLAFISIHHKNPVSTLFCAEIYTFLPRSWRVHSLYYRENWKQGKAHEIETERKEWKRPMRCVQQCSFFPPGQQGASNHNTTSS